MANHRFPAPLDYLFSYTLNPHHYYDIKSFLFFQGYSYVAPSILFSENQITQDFLMPSTINQPKNAHVSLASQFKVSLLR